MTKKSNNSQEVTDYAMQLWDNQSPDLPLTVRIERIVKHCKARKYNPKLISLPVHDLDKYINRYAN